MKTNLLTPSKSIVTSIRLTPDERDVFRELADRLQTRSMGQAVRLVVRETVKILQEQESNSVVGKDCQ